jgi:7-carboxy-7-deazaguanine synthase
MDDSKKIVLTEEAVFYTLQGEGTYAGHPSLFIRTSGCNLRCAWRNPDGQITRCDTPYSSFSPEKNPIEIGELKRIIAQYPSNVHIVITGGEPMMHKNLDGIITFARVRGHSVTIETNGTLYWENGANHFSISPKLSTSSSDPDHGLKHEERRMNFASMASIIKNHDYQFKFVYNTPADVEEILNIRENLMALTGININQNIWLMPQGTTDFQFNSKAEEIWEVCKKYGWKYTDRLHIRTYGQKKGV